MRKDIKEAIDAIDTICQYAYEHVLHELGYDPVHVIRTALRTALLAEDWRKPSIEMQQAALHASRQHGAIESHVGNALPIGYELYASQIVWQAMFDTALRTLSKSTSGNTGSDTRAPASAPAHPHPRTRRHARTRAHEAPIFSGNASIEFWDKINEVKDEKTHAAIYFIGCKLQELETRLMEPTGNE